MSALDGRWLSALPTTLTSPLPAPVHRESGRLSSATDHPMKDAGGRPSLDCPTWIALRRRHSTLTKSGVSLKPLQGREPNLGPSTVPGLPSQGESFDGALVKRLIRCKLQGQYPQLLCCR